MKTYSNLLNLATTLSNNTSAANQTLISSLMNEQQRLLIENYFDNERSFSTETIGAMNLDLTGVVNQSALSATLTSTWNYASGSQLCTFSNTSGITHTVTATSASGAVSATLTSPWSGPTGLLSITFDNTNTRDVEFTNGSTALTWTVPLSSATSTTTITTAGTSQVLSVSFQNGSATIEWTNALDYAITNTSFPTQGFQKYRIPAGISKITNGTISVGQLRFVPAPVQTRSQWDMLNFLPYPSDIVNYFYIYGPYVEFWPVPSTTGNKITFNYKTRVADFSSAFLFSDASGTAYVPGQTTFDYQKGTISSASVDGVNITGTSTSWNITGKFPTGVDISEYNLSLRIDPPYGDGLWYPIQQFTDDTHLILSTPIMNAPNISSATYSIGQLPVLQEDFHELIAYRSLLVYFSTIYPDPNRYDMFDKMCKERMGMLEEYAGTKQVNYNLGERPALLNPNSYPYYPGNVNS